jgi:hypothetical protein
MNWFTKKKKQVEEESKKPNGVKQIHNFKLKEKG